MFEVKENDKLLLVTNDDSINSKGIRALEEVALQFGKVVVVAPFEGQSGMAHAITVKHPLRVNKVSESATMLQYTTSGTPVDCVKMAINRLLPRKPDIVLAGINHGANSSSSVIYSGTMAATLEGCINEIPSIGFSLLDFAKDADFSVAKKFVHSIIQKVLENSIPKGICLNVNIPSLPENEIEGIKICRQNHGIWREEFEHRTDPGGHDYYWLTGTLEDMEPNAEDTDEWALRNKYVSIVPVQFDMTAHQFIQNLDNWNFKNV
jgi:5'-nucleotidase